MDEDPGQHDRQALQASTSRYESDADNSVPSSPKLRIGCALLPKKVAYAFVLFLCPSNVNVLVCG